MFPYNILLGKIVWYLPSEEFYPLSVGGEPVFRRHHQVKCMAEGRGVYAAKIGRIKPDVFEKAIQAWYGIFVHLMSAREGK